MMTTTTTTTKGKKMLSFARSLSLSL